MRNMLVHIKGESHARCRENPVGCPSAFLCLRQAKTPLAAVLTDLHCLSSNSIDSEAIKLYNSFHAYRCVVTA